MKKAIIIIPAILICLGLIWFLFLREEPTNIPDSSTIEEYEETKEDKDYDLTDKYSETEKAEMKNQAKELINKYLSSSIHFTLKKQRKKSI